MKLFILAFCLMYLVLGFVWYIADTSMERAVVNTEGTTKWSRRFSRALFVMTWPYWLYVNLRLTYIQYKTMQVVMNRRKGN